jgi:transposase-like protein
MSEFVPLPPQSACSAVSQRFTHQQTCVLHALASGLTPTEAAEQAGVNRSQLYAWMDQPRFRISLENAQREHFTAIAGRFHRLAVNAQNALEQIVNDPKCSPHARIKAANIILAHLERGQPALPRTAAEVAAIDQQCKDEHAPHIVVGRRIESVTDPDANQPVARQIVTEIGSIPANVTDPDAETGHARQILTESETLPNDSATDPDTKSGSAMAAPRQILTENMAKAAARKKDIYEQWLPIMSNMLRHMELKYALLNAT